MKLTKIEYKKVFEENKKLKKKLEIIEKNNKEKPVKKK